MKTKTIYLLRHGETDFNKKGMVQGRGIDASLNEKGREQSKQVFNWLKGVSFDRIYTSSLLRTQETVKPFTATDFHPLDGFDEISWGNQEGAVATKEAHDLYMQAIRNWGRGQLDETVGGGENPVEVMNRQRPAMQQVLDNEGEQVLICMHGRAMRILLCWLLNYPLNYMDGFPHENCGYYKLMFRGGVFHVEEFNQIAHLDG